MVSQASWRSVSGTPAALPHAWVDVAMAAAGSAPVVDVHRDIGESLRGLDARCHRLHGKVFLEADDAPHAFEVDALGKVSRPVLARPVVVGHLIGGDAVVDLLGVDRPVLFDERVLAGEGRGKSRLQGLVAPGRRRACLRAAEARGHPAGNEGGKALVGAGDLDVELVRVRREHRVGAVLGAPEDRLEGGGQADVDVLVEARHQHA